MPFHKITVIKKEEDIKERLEDVRAPCVILVWTNDKETRCEWIDIIFKKEKMFFTTYLPSIILIILWIVLIIYNNL